MVIGYASICWWCCYLLAMEFDCFEFKLLHFASFACGLFSYLPGIMETALNVVACGGRFIGL